MDKSKGQSENPLSGIISQDRRVTRSVARALESQVVGSILTQIDTGIEKDIDFVPTDFLNRCANRIFGRLSGPATSSTPGNTIGSSTASGDESQLNFSQKLARVINMSQDQGTAPLAQNQDENPSGGSGPPDQIGQLMSVLYQQSQMMASCMNEIRQMRGDMLSLSQRVAEVEHSGNASAIIPPNGSSSTPGDPNREANVAQIGPRSGHAPEIDEQQHQSTPNRDGANRGRPSQSNRDRDITYSARELDIRKPIDLDRWHIKFDGTGRDMTVESFIFRVERMREQYNISHSQLLSDFHCLVSGSAAKWYWQILEDNAEDMDFDYFVLKKELLKHFRSADTDYEIIKEIMERKQQSGEGFEEYYADVHNLTFRLRKKIPEADLVKIVRGNLRSNLASLTFSANISTIADLRTECKRAERLLKENRQRNRQVNEISVWNTNEEEVDVSLEAMSAPNKFMNNTKVSKTPNGQQFARNPTAANNRYVRNETSQTSQPSQISPEERFCLSPFHLNLCFSCGMPGDFYRKNFKDLKTESVCRSTFHEMKCFACGKDDSFCTFTPKKLDVAERTGSFCQEMKIPE